MDFHLLNEDVEVLLKPTTPTGTAIAITSAMPIAKPIPRPIRHCFEQQVERSLKFQNRNTTSREN